MSSAVGNAKLDGLTKDLHITGNQYLLTLTIYFIGYVRFSWSEDFEMFQLTVEGPL